MIFHKGKNRNCIKVPNAVNKFFFLMEVSHTNLCFSEVLLSILCHLPLMMFIITLTCLLYGMLIPDVCKTWHDVTCKQRGSGCTKWTDDVFILQMTWQWLIAKYTRVYVNLTLQGCLVLCLKFFGSKKLKNCFLTKEIQPSSGLLCDMYWIWGLPRWC